MWCLSFSCFCFVHQKKTKHLEQRAKTNHVNAIREREDKHAQDLAKLSEEKHLVEANLEKAVAPKQKKEASQVSILISSQVQEDPLWKILKEKGRQQGKGELKTIQRLLH